MLSYLDDIRSDLSVFHRIEELECMPADRFFSYAERLLAYSGALQARARHEQNVRPELASVSAAGATSRNRPAVRVEQDDTGTRIENGVAVDERGVPLWIKKKASEKGDSGEIDIIPGTAAALAFSPAFKGQFSYAQVAAVATVAAEGVSDD